MVRPDGVDGLRLGTNRAEVAAAGFEVPHWESDHGCSQVVPATAEPGPGDGVQRER